MIVPSIDIMNGQAVQLVGGKEKVLDAGDPRPLAEKFGVVGEIAVVDLDAALGRGNNTNLIRELVQIARCRIGGGIRSVDAAIQWLDAGATQVVLGTAAKPEILRELPPERVVAALDAVDGEVVVEGWQTHTGRNVREQVRELRDLVGGFLVTFVEREGRLQGSDLNLAEQLREDAGETPITIAGGITTVDEIAALDRLGCDAQVGMALYSGRMNLADAFAAPLISDRSDGLWPTVVVDELGVALGLAWSNAESLRAAIAEQIGVYWSRSRGLWRKGATSGATQQLRRVDLDCDRDALRFTVSQSGTGFCHEDTWTCWGDDHGLGALARLLAERTRNAPAGSYTRRLLDDPELLGKKLVEEARELAAAQGTDDVAWEAADVLYFTLVALARGDVGLHRVVEELDQRNRKVTRRRGDAKT